MGKESYIANPKPKMPFYKKDTRIPFAADGDIFAYQIGTSIE